MIRTYHDRDLSNRNTFGMKVSCACYIGYDRAEELADIDFSQLPQPVLSIGAGSNLLFTGDFPGTLLHSSVKFLREVGRGEGEVLVEAGAGVTFDDFVDWACSLGLWGAENLSGIPGEVGAAAVQNIGAYGVEAKDIIVRVNCFDTVRHCTVTFENKDLHYGYRTSFFKENGVKGRFVVTSVLLRLTEEYSPKLDYGGVREALAGSTVNSPRDVRKVILAIRSAKLPDPAIIGSAGSFFKNPVVSEEHFARIQALAHDECGAECSVPHFTVNGGIKIPAAWLIDRCGLKGARCGGAAVHESQPLVIVNLTGDATPQDVLSIEKTVKEKVKERFGVELEPEVEHL